MATGITLRLYNGATARTSLSGLVCLWWDSTDVYDFDAPQGRTDAGTTDGSGDLILDLSDVTGLSSGGWGYLLVRKEDGTDHEDSLVFQGRVQVGTVSSGAKLTYSDGWTRPADWLSLGTLPGSGDHKFIGLHAVWKGGSNWCAFQFTCSGASQYTVNWGDGSSEDVNSGVTAYHSFDYTSLAGSTETGIADARACTFQDSGDTVTLAGHGFLDGTEISFSTITSTTGISTYTRYWVRDVSGSTFKVAATKGGSALALTTDGSGAVYLPGYRQALVTVVPKTGGAEFTAANFNLRHTSASSGLTYTTGWLDVYLNAPSVTSLTVSASSINVSQGLLERFQAPALGAVTDFNNMFYRCYSLQSIPLLDTAAGTSFSSMFSYCSSLQSIPLLDTAAGTNFNNMFTYCYSLQYIPLLNTAAGTNFSSMFQDCYSLQRAAMVGTAYNISYASAQLSASALDEIYTHLATVTGKTITVTGNYGVSGDTPSIATAKGWTVTG